jgi:hypothetical protein
MTSSPFDRHREPAALSGPNINLRAWCEETNAKDIMKRMERWYFVTKADDIERVDCLDGTDGGNVRKLIAGELRDFAGWSAHRMRGYRRWLKRCADAGTLYGSPLAENDRSWTETDTAA